MPGPSLRYSPTRRVMLVTENNDTPVAYPATVPYVDSTTPLAASGSFIGTTRDLGATLNPSVKTINAMVLATVAGTLFIEGSSNGSTWLTLATSAVAANVRMLISSPVFTRYWRVRYVNGATLQTSMSLFSNTQT